MAARPRKTSYTNYSVTTQGFVEDHGFDGVTSIFLVPVEEGAPRLVASASFPGVL